MCRVQFSQFGLHSGTGGWGLAFPFAIAVRDAALRRVGSGGSAGLEIALAALSSISGKIGETCRESVGGRARGEPGVRRAETDCCLSMSTSVSIAWALCV